MPVVEEWLEKDSKNKNIKSEYKNGDDIYSLHRESYKCKSESENSSASNRAEKLYIVVAKLQSGKGFYG